LFEGMDGPEIYKSEGEKGQIGIAKSLLSKE
jgi:hypothetical protein